MAVEEEDADPVVEIVVSAEVIEVMAPEAGIVDEAVSHKKAIKQILDSNQPSRWIPWAWRMERRRW